MIVRIAKISNNPCWPKFICNFFIFSHSFSDFLGLKCIYRKSIYNTQRNIVLAWESISFLNCFRNAILYNFYTFFLQMQLKLFPELKHVSKERPPLCSSPLLNKVGSFWWKCLFMPRLIWKPTKWNYFWLVLQRRSKVMKVQMCRSTHSTHLPPNADALQLTTFLLNSAPSSSWSSTSTSLSVKPPTTLH